MRRDGYLPLNTHLVPLSNGLVSSTLNDMSQQTLLTVSEGGIPAQVETILDLVGATDQVHNSITTQRDARISTVPLSESLAIPLASDIPAGETPAEWPEDVRGMPAYRPVNRELDYSVRPMGANNIEWTFLQFMFTGVRVVGVSVKRGCEGMGADAFCDSLRIGRGGGRLGELRMKCSSTRLGASGRHVVYV